MRPQHTRTVNGPTSWTHFQTNWLRVNFAKTALLLALISNAHPSGGQEVHIQTPSTSLAAAKSQGPVPTPREHSLRVKVDLVLIPVTVTDHAGRIVTNLDQANFDLFEDKEKQTIKHISPEDAPLSLGIILDTSGSMVNKLARAVPAVFASTKICASGGVTLTRTFACCATNIELMARMLVSKQARETCL